MASKGLSELLPLGAHLRDEPNLPFLYEEPLSVPEVTQTLSFFLSFALLFLSFLFSFLEP